MKRLFVAALLIGPVACTGSGDVTEGVSFDQAPSARFLSLSSGTSFGFCMGYCVTELVVDTTRLTFTESSRDPVGYPTKIRTQPLSSADWTRIRGLVDPAVLTGLAGVHGCPDCADGGSEWIQVGLASGNVRVTIEHGDVLGPIGQLQAEIRALRGRFR